MNGASIANEKPVIAKMIPKRSVLWLTVASVFQYFLKNTGKKPAITVV